MTEKTVENKTQDTAKMKSMIKRIVESTKKQSKKISESVKFGVKKGVKLYTTDMVPCLIDSIMFQKRSNLVVKNHKSLDVGDKIPLNTRDYLVANLVNEGYKKERYREDIDNYKYKFKESSANKLVYINDTNKTIIFIAKGTDAFNKNYKLYDDLITNISIVLGNFATSKRFLGFIKFYDKLKLKYPDYKIITAGHSLGGTVALFLSKMRNIPAIVYNCAVVGDDVYKDLVKNKKARIISQIGDPISNILPLDPTNLILLGKPNLFCGDNHRMENFLSPEAKKNIKQNPKYAMAMAAVVGVRIVVPLVGAKLTTDMIYRKIKSASQRQEDKQKRKESLDLR